MEMQVQVNHVERMKKPVKINYSKLNTEIQEHGSMVMITNNIHVFYLMSSPDK